jgi:hypothetical protein
VSAQVPTPPLPRSPPGLRATAPKEIMLMPGELFFGKDVPCLRTLLGSCVAMTL